MSSEDQKIPIPILFTQGVDTKTDHKLVAPGRLLNCKNGQFGKSSIAKRFGKDLLSDEITDGTFLTGGHTLPVFEDELLYVGTGDEMYSYSEERDSNVPKGMCPTLKFNTKSLVFNAAQQLHADCDVLSGIEVYVWEDSRGGCRYSVFDQTTGVSFASDVSLNATAIYPQVVACVDAFFIFYSVAGELTFRKVPIGTPASLTDEVVVLTGMNVTVPKLLVRRLGSNFIAVFRDSANDIILTYITNAGAQGSITNGFPDAITIAEIPMGAISLDVSEGNGSEDPLLGAARFAIAWQSSSGVKCRYYDYSFGDILGGTQILDAETDTSNNITCIHVGENKELVYFFYEYRITDEPHNTFIKMAILNVETQTITAGVLLLRSVGIMSQGFEFDDDPLFFIVHESLNGLQNTIFLVRYFLVDSTARIITKFSPGESQGLTVKSRVSKVVENEDGTFVYPSGFKSSTLVEDLTFFSTVGLRRNFIDFGISSLPLQFIEHGDALFMASGLAYSYDGKALVEAGFHYFPEGLEAADGGAGNVADGTYQYAALYKWYNNKGNLERSAPSVPITLVVTGGPNENDVTIPTLRLTDKTDVVIELYRTENAETVFYKVGETANSLTTDTVVIVDNIADADLLDNEPLYTTGGIIENAPFPSVKAMDVHQDRLFVVPRERDATAIFSQKRKENHVTELIEEFTLKISDQKSMTAIRGMDANIVLFCRDDIYVSVGEGPDATGAGSFYTDPVVAHTDVGSIDGVVAKVPDGLIFKSAKGIYLLTRGLQAQYIGKDVEFYNDHTITSAVLVDDLNEVRFTTEEGVTLVYHYLAGQWSTFHSKDVAEYDNSLAGRSYSVLTRGKWTQLLPSGRVYQENKNIFKDGKQNYSMTLETAWVKMANLLSGIQRISECLLTGEYKGPHYLKVKVAYDYEESWVDTYYFSTASALADGVNYFGSDDYFGHSTSIFRDIFAGNDDSEWINVTTVGGPITVEDEVKRMAGSGITADDLGFWRIIPQSGGSLSGKILQFELNFDPDTTSAIVLATVNLAEGIDYINGVSIEFNSFPTPEINMFDYGGNPVGGAIPLSEFDLTKQYVGKFRFNEDGTVTAFVDGEGLDNYELGTTDVADDFLEGPVYLSTNQTLITPEENASIWDDIFFHDQGLGFDYEAYNGPPEDRFGGSLTNVYQFRFFLSRPKCQALKFEFSDLVEPHVQGLPVTGESFSITELTLTAKVEGRGWKLGEGRTVERSGVGL